MTVDTSPVETESAVAVDRRVLGVPVRDAVLHVTVEGDPARPVLLLLHGFPDTSAVWDGVAERLRDRFLVVRHDNRGAGASRLTSTSARFDFDQLVDDIAAVMDSVSPDRPVHLAGHDWGAIQGWEVVTSPRIRERILSFTSISGPSLDGVARWMRRAMRKPTRRGVAGALDQTLHSWYIYVFTAPLGSRFAGNPRVARRWLGALRRLEGLDGRHAVALQPESVRAGIALYRANMPRRLTRPQRVATEVPVQVIVPTGDRYVMPATSIGAASVASRVDLRTISAGHWAPATKPDVIARWIGEHADRVEAERAGVVDAARVAERASRGRPLEGRLALVTGAGSGIGRATALALAENGANVVVVDIDTPAAERTVELVRLLDAGVAAEARRVDVGDAAAMERLAAELVSDLGVPDIIVNNAGVGLAGSFLDTTPEDWRRLLDVNLWGVIHGCRVFGRLLVERGRGGTIVNVASAAAYIPSRALPAYSTSKAAVLMLSECLRAELAGNGIGVSAICPGIINTSITRTSRFVGVSDAEQERRRARAASLYDRRNVSPDAVARAIVDAILHDRPVVPVTVEARVARVASRLWPGVMRRLARIEPRT